MLASYIWSNRGRKLNVLIHLFWNSTILLRQVIVVHEIARKSSSKDKQSVSVLIKKSVLHPVSPLQSLLRIWRHWFQSWRDVQVFAFASMECRKEASQHFQVRPWFLGSHSLNYLPAVRTCSLMESFAEECYPTQNGLDWENLFRQDCRRVLLKARAQSYIPSGGPEELWKLWTEDLRRVTFFFSAAGDRSGRALMLLRNINPTSDHFCEDCDRPLTSSPQQSEACQCHSWSPQPVIESIDERWSLQDKRERELFQDHTREEGIFRKFVVQGISWNVFSRRYLFNVVRVSVKFLFKN